MAFDDRALENYIDVAERMTEFYAKYPEGSLRAAVPEKPWELAIVSGTKKDGQETTQTFIVYTAVAYRHPGDPAPGVGVAWEIWPGRTPYTLGSELMNAETSAWGRAMAALGIATKRGIASRQEVQNRRAEREDGLPTNKDGSLSRSQTTDAEKEAAGVMTEAQNTEHSQLVKGADGALPRAEAAKVRHAKVTRPDDPFYNIPAEPENTAPASDDQVRAIAIRLGEYGHKTRDAKLVWLSARFNRKIGSSKELTCTEALAVLQELPQRAKAVAP